MRSSPKDGQNILLIVCKLRYKVEADDVDDADDADADADDVDVDCVENDVDILWQYLVIAQDAKCQLLTLSLALLLLPLPSPPQTPIYWIYTQMERDKRDRVKKCCREREAKENYELGVSID